MLDGIPLLVRERETVEAAIAEAKESGRTQWYEAAQDVQCHGAYRHHVRKRRAYLDGVLGAFRRARTGKTVALDLGCGDGVHLEWLGSYADRVYGSDYNILRLARARAREAAAAVFMGEITNYPARDASFDLVFFNHVLEHIPDDAAALAETHRILKEGGLLVLGVPNEGAMFWRLAYRLQPLVRAQSDHVHFYTAATLGAKCRAAGFTVRQIEHLGWGVPHWSLDERLRRYKAVDDAFDAIGRRLVPHQATSLYLLLTK